MQLYSYITYIGKTVTLVETIKQLTKKFDSRPGDDRILVCAPSNTAADLLIARLSDTFNSHEMCRVMSFQRTPGEVSNVVMDYSNYDQSIRGFSVPPLEKLKTYKVIVTTLMMSGKLYNFGLDEHSFSAVVVDEAGHAWEPEICCTFPFLLKPSGLLVLAGDPQQLGPVTYSDSSLNVSMLERILQCGPYARNNEGQYNPACITKLIYSYRCHPDIMKIPNRLFYEGDLIDATSEESRVLCGWNGLKNPKFPLIFHGINGENDREANSPSWFNRAEIEQVLYYVNNVLQTTRTDIKDIGIIAPYQKQVQKIRKLLDAKGLKGAMVGSCEQFQGQERKVIIISTVRSSTELLSSDARYNLGFVANRKRLNVAVTRAKSLLIIIGNPAVLWTDPNWRALLEHIMANDGYTGVPPPNSGDDSDDDNVKTNLPKKRNRFAKKRTLLADENSRKKKKIAHLSNSEKLLEKACHVKEFSRTWLLLFSLSMSKKQRRLALKHLPTHVTPFLPQPLLLADYLIQTVHSGGGVVGILALESLFQIIVQHNLDYPHFFEALYRMCNADVFSAKYRSKFTTLLHTSLKSTNLPAYTGAAFIKRLTNLAIKIPGPSASFCLAQAVLLLRTHPQCHKLIHNTDKAVSEGVLNEILHLCGLFCSFSLHLFIIIFSQYTFNCSSTSHCSLCRCLQWRCGRHEQLSRLQLLPVRGRAIAAALHS